MSKFIDSTGMSSILAAIKNKFATKDEITSGPNIWTGTRSQFTAIAKKNNNTLYFVKKS